MVRSLRGYIKDSELDPKDGGRKVPWNRVVKEHRGLVFHREQTGREQYGKPSTRRPL